MLDDTTNVLYATVDSLRKDAVSPETMPYVRELADDGIWFEQMISTAPATAASFMGLMASRFYADVDGIGLPDEEFTTLAESLPEEYHCAGRSTNQFTSAFYNYDRGFDQFNSPSQDVKFKIRKHLDEDGWFFNHLEWGYQHFLMAQSNSGAVAPSYFNTPAEKVNADVLGQLDGESPFFAWVHHMDVHHPLEPPEDYLPESVESRREAQQISRDIPGRVPDNRQRDLERVRELYNVECRYWDDEFQALHEELPEDTLVVVVGDHGELLGEHSRYGHPHEMWRELVNVPCLFYHPNLPSATVESQQTTLDLAPTILDLIGVDTPTAMRGRPIDLEEPSGRDEVFGTIETPDKVGFARTAEHKWVRHLSRRSTQDDHGELLFRTGADEDHQAGNERAGDDTAVVRELRSAYEATMDGTIAAGHTLDDDQVKRHMADLGYLDQQ